jgi:hypothetical protein
MTQVILGKSRVREICMPGSVRAKAEWLSYSTISTEGVLPLLTSPEWRPSQLQFF